MKRAVLFLLAACGGAASSTRPAGTAPGEHPTASENESIGEQALAQGGFSVLGGGDAREPEGPIGPPLAMRSVLAESPVKLDGRLKEWPKLSPARLVQGNAGKTAAGFALQYDDNNVYVAGEIDAATFVRTAKLAESEDHVVFSIAVPVGGTLVGYDLALFAGKTGETAGTVRYLSGAHRGEEISGAKIVEAPHGNAGYTFEALIPWAALGRPSLRMGMRGGLGAVTREGMHATSGNVGKAAATPKSLPQVLTEPELALADGLLEPRGLVQSAPSFDTFADINGDGTKERVAIYGTLLTICGPKFREGKQFFFREVGGDPAGLEARAVVTKGRDDLLLRRRIKVEKTTRELLEVWSFKGDEPETVFAAELAVTGEGGKRITNAARIRLGEIDVSVDRAVGWDAANYSEPHLTDLDSILLPWGSVKSRAYRLEGGRFTRAKEAVQEPVRTEVKTAPPVPKDLPTPKVTRGSELAGRALDEFRKERNVDPSVKPKADLGVSVAEDPRMERVVLLERDLLVFGPGFRSGNRYEYITLEAFEKASDIAEVTARDLTGDGNAEIIVRGVRRNAHAAGQVESDVMLIYTVDDKGIRRIFAIETGRSVGDKRVQGMVQFVPGARNFEIDVQPGVAKGFTERTYPFGEDAPGGSYEPVLLPWGKTKKLRYVWDGTKFTTKS